MSALLEKNTTKTMTVHSAGNYYWITDSEIPELPIIYFDSHFPVEWVSYRPCSYDEPYGPFYCNACRAFGFYKGVFIGYCVDCAEKGYDRTRGRGMLEVNYEKDMDCVSSMFGSRWCNAHREKSMWNTYLKGVDKTKIGDTVLETSKYWKELPRTYPKPIQQVDEDEDENNGLWSSSSWLDDEEEENEYEDEDNDDEEIISKEELDKIHRYVNNSGLSFH